MRFLKAATLLLYGLISPTSLVVRAEPNQNALSSDRLALPRDFKPPQVFRNENLVRNTNLEKGYVRETINVVVENVDKKAQNDYYLPFPTDVFVKLGGLEVRDKKAPEKGRFDVDVTELDSSRDVQFAVTHLPEPLAPSSQITLSISYYVLNALRPLPAAVNQIDRQFLVHSFSAYVPSAYPTITQKTKLKLPSSLVADYTETVGIKSDSGADPERQGATYTYGPYNTAKVAPGTLYPVSVRYDFTKPVLTASLLERDLEVSHWGGNLATEERYWLHNNGSKLLNQFNRVHWTLSSWQNLPTFAAREIKYPLKPGSVDPYFIDDVGNVTTSNYRPGKPKRGAQLELHPRFPIFGGWNYSFRVGWNNGLPAFLRRTVPGGDTFALKVPFLEGPRAPEGIQYDKVVVRIILPEGAKGVQYEIVEGSSSNGLPGPDQIRSHLSTHKTYMDTLGRSVLTLAVDNLSDEARDSEIVVTYRYSTADALRKPLTVTAGMLAVFVAAWLIGKIDVSIKKR